MSQARRWWMVMASLGGVLCQSGVSTAWGASLEPGVQATISLGAQAAREEDTPEPGEEAVPPEEVEPKEEVEGAEGPAPQESEKAAPAGTASGLPATLKPGQKQPYHGWMTLLEEYRGRVLHVPEDSAKAEGGVAASDETDHDIRLFVEGGGRNRSETLGANLSLGVWQDVGGQVPTDGVTSLASQYDGEGPQLDVYLLSMDYRGGAIMREARVGRQHSDTGVPLTFDGLRVELAANPQSRFYALAGRTVHFFEVDAEVFEDWVANLGAVYRFSPSLRAEVDYRFLKEDVSGLEVDDRAPVQRHLYSASLWYRQGDWLYARAHLRGLDASLARGEVAGRVTLSERGLGGDLRLEVQPITLSEINESLDPYFAILGPSLPHVSWRVDLWKTLQTGVGLYGLHGGWAGKQIIEGEEAAFNHNVGRLYLIAEGTDIAVPGLYASLALEGHYTYLDWSLSSDLILAAGGTVGFARGPLRVEGGSYYQRYKYNYYADVQETENVRTWYAQGAYKLTRWLALKARYDFERSDRDLHTATLTVSQIF